MACAGMCGEAVASTLPRTEVHRWVCMHCAACAPRKLRKKENEHEENEHEDNEFRVLIGGTMQQIA